MRIDAKTASSLSGTEKNSECVLDLINEWIEFRCKYGLTKHVERLCDGAYTKKGASLAAKKLRLMGYKASYNWFTHTLKVSWQ